MKKRRRAQKGGWMSRKQALVDIYEHCERLLDRFDDFSAIPIPREVLELLLAQAKRAPMPGGGRKPATTHQKAQEWDVLDKYLRMIEAKVAKGTNRKSALAQVAEVAAEELKQKPETVKAKLEKRHLLRSAEFSGREWLNFLSESAVTLGDDEEEDLWGEE
jgi:hypothetical protein